MTNNNSLLRVPYAIYQGEKISPDKAVKGKEYFCPECRSKLIQRTGNKVRNHFAHHGINNQCDFLNEGWVHLSAKYQIKLQIENWINKVSSSPVLHRVCPFCKKKKVQQLPEIIEKVSLEKQIDGCQVDVALFDKSDNIICAIEVKDKHAVNEEKVEKLAIPWFEVEAEKILTVTQKWEVVQEGNLKPFRCKCWEATEMHVVQRGLSLHVDYCPIGVRVWKGKPYANFINDCTYCEHLVAHLQDFDYDNYVFCSGCDVNPHPQRKQAIIYKKKEIERDIKTKIDSEKR